MLPFRMRAFIIYFMFGSLVHGKDLTEGNQIMRPQDVLKNYQTLVNENRGQPRIIGGEPVEHGDYPWFAAMFYEVDDNEPDFQCGGWIYDKNTVVTLASCGGWDPNQEEVRFFIKAGDERFPVEDKTEQIRYVKEFRTFPKYDELSLGNNLAVLILEESLDMNDYVQSINVPASWKDALLQNRDECEISGWGRTRTSWNSYRLQVVDAPIWDRAPCRRFLKSLASTPFRTNQLCTRNFDGNGPCTWDYGSPLVCYDNKNAPYIVGMVEAYDSNCGLGFALHTRVSKFRKWIAKQAKEADD